MEGVDRDMHGAHMITTSGFDNYHVSHVELFNVGQPRLARYPIHWHHAGYVGDRDAESADDDAVRDVDVESDWRDRDADGNDDGTSGTTTMLRRPR